MICLAHIFLRSFALQGPTAPPSAMGFPLHNIYKFKSSFKIKYDMKANVWFKQYYKRNDTRVLLLQLKISDEK